MDKLSQKRQQVATRIAALLEEKGWTQQQLADKAGVKKSYISSVLAGDANLTLSSIVRFETALKALILTVPNE
jgi:transcriptional regulator with XRE-family HTH domain